MLDIDKIQWPGWETTRLIGRGSFGAVYEIKRTVLGGEEEFAAMKVISIPQSDSDIEELVGEGYDNKTISTMFEDHRTSIVGEYSTMKKMSGCHNIVACDDIKYFQHEDGIGWDILIKMELLTPLMKSLPQSVDENVVINVGIDICSALEICEENNIVHRDIKPQNIFLSKYGDYKLGDFGIAKTVEKTTGGTKIGTYDYMAPEVYNNKPYGSSADIYSLGLVLYWLLNNRRLPFLPQPPEMPTSKMKESARLQRFHGEEIPEPVNGSAELKNIILKACAFDEKNRYTDAAEMKQALVKLTVPEPEPEPEPLPPPPPPPTPGPNVKIIVIIASMAILAIAVIAGIIFANNKPGIVVNQTTEGISVSGDKELTTQEDKTEESTTEETTEEESTEETTTEETTTENNTELTTLDSGKLYRPDENKFCNQYKRYVSGYFEGQKYAKMRFGPSKSKFDVVGKINNGKIVTVQTKSIDGWTLIDYEGVEGWVRTDFLFSTYDECFSTEQPTTTKPITTKPTTTKPTTTKPTTTKPISISNIEIKSSPSKLSYYVGDSLDSSGLVLTIAYSNGKLETVTTGYTCSPTTLDSSGTQNITVAYGGKTTTYSVKVTELELISISLKRKPIKDTYYVGQSLSKTGLKLTATYNNGTSKTIMKTSDVSCSPSKMISAGTQTITVNYKGKTTTFTVEVKRPTITLSKYSESKSMDCWDSYWSTTRLVPFWEISLPDVTTKPNSDSVSWSIVSGSAYIYEGKIRAQQPGTIVARATFTYYGYSYTADYSVSLSIYKQPTALNYLKTSPSKNSGTITNVPTGVTVYITEVAWDASVQASDKQYYLWGKTTYNGKTGWIVIS